MNKKTLYIVWSALYALCAGLGFVQGAAGFGKFLLVLTGVVFFVPPILLTLRARKENDRSALKTLRLISIGSLSLTLILLLLNFLYY